MAIYLRTEVENCKDDVFCPQRQFCQAERLSLAILPSLRRTTSRKTLNELAFGHGPEYLEMLHGPPSEMLLVHKLIDEPTLGLQNYPALL